MNLAQSNQFDRLNDLELINEFAFRQHKYNKNTIGIMKRELYSRNIDQNAIVEYRVIALKTYEIKTSCAGCNENLELEKADVLDGYFICPECGMGQSVKCPENIYSSFDQPEFHSYMKVLRNPDIGPCQICSKLYPLRKVCFNQNIGMVFQRQQKTFEGHLCIQCINRIFWEYTSITFFVGWLGIISMFMAPCIILANLAAYTCSLFWAMKPEIRKSVAVIK